MLFDWWQSLMVSHHSAKFGGHRHCGSRGIMLLVAEEENSRCSCIDAIYYYCLFLKNMSWKHTAYHISSGPGHTHSKQQLIEYLKISFSSLSKSNEEKEKETKQKKSNCKVFCITRKRDKIAEQELRVSCLKLMIHKRFFINASFNEDIYPVCFLSILLFKLFQKKTWNRLL